MALGNPSARTLDGRARAFAQEMGLDGMPVFAEYFGHSTTNTLSTGKPTRFAFQLPPRKPRVYVPVVSLSPLKSANGLTHPIRMVATRRKTFDRIEVKARATSQDSKAPDGSWRLTAPRAQQGYQLDQIQVNGQNRPVPDNGGPNPEPEAEADQANAGHGNVGGNRADEQPVVQVTLDGLPRSVHLIYRHPRTDLPEAKVTALRAFDDNDHARLRLTTSDDAPTKKIARRLNVFYRDYLAGHRFRHGQDFNRRAYYRKSVIRKIKTGIKINTSEDLPSHTVLLRFAGANLSRDALARAGKDAKIGTLSGNPDQGWLVLHGPDAPSLQTIAYEYMTLVDLTTHADWFGVIPKEQKGLHWVSMTSKQRQLFGDRYVHLASAARKRTGMPLQPPSSQTPSAAGQNESNAQAKPEIKVTLLPVLDPSKNLIQPQAWVFGKGYKPIRRATFDADRDHSTFLTKPASLHVRSRSIDYSGYWKQTVPVKPGQTYFAMTRAKIKNGRVLVWLHAAEKGRQFSKGILWFKGKPNFLSPVFLPEPRQTGGDQDQGRWRVLARSITTPPWMSRLTLGLGSYFGTGDIWFDDAYFGPSPGPLKLEITGHGSVRSVEVRLARTSDLIFKQTLSADNQHFAGRASGTHADEAYNIRVIRADGSTLIRHYPNPDQSYYH